MRPGNDGYGVMLETAVEASLAEEALNLCGDPETARMVHDLTPLGQVQGHTREMIDGFGRLTEEMREAIHNGTFNANEWLASTSRVHSLEAAPRFEPIIVEGPGAQNILDSLDLMSRSKRINGVKIKLGTRVLAGSMVQDFIDKQNGVDRIEEARNAVMRYYMFEHITGDDC